MTTATKIHLTDREEQVVQCLAEGLRPRQIALQLTIREGTVHSYVALAKRKLGASGTAAAVEAAYAARVLLPPESEVGKVDLPVEQRELIPLIARSMTGVQMAAHVKRPLKDVRSDVLALLKALGAGTRAHVPTRARQLGLATQEKQGETKE
ncbi:response regulator transcription factor [Streptomyces prunicolor]|uniref:response regulator transcription factor n=1 Tax=Streptomyces prunicolor TaxID=67348 RepID=UPI0003735164|nr:LuxR C-terminal-related transcriptional regulator [Streptomyces prunicolor]